MWYGRAQKKWLESHTREGDSPVFEAFNQPRGIPSNAGHGKSCMNPARPWAKPKYKSLTERELVP